MADFHIDSKQFNIIGDIGHVRLEPGDVIVVTSPRQLPAQAMNIIRQQVGSIFAGHKCVVLDAGMKFEVARPAGAGDCHKLDTPERVFFYEQDFYVLSNFSAFAIMWKGLRFDTSEAVYHWEKFNNPDPTPFEDAVLDSIRCAPSAHVAFKIGQEHKRLRRPDWDDVKVDVMREILRAKADQHEYVRRKLLATGDRELIEDSWRDDFWGWGPNRDGKNALGKLWMEIRAEIRAREVVNG
ncbi:NADAR family protein [Aminobacter aminovorans]|uniref:NADAR domain-containing protein n=1 Tax=Aminobacter aminovorans TaxID=83263 RepID=A0AAC8YMU3_AMIAI|nr:NADAR family protein [Aminobacter aminovorans]AMS41217.1 hypothetical protein AA2016_2289 [Aminobacter aminovorans]MBB3705800.1 hypothetical protein [Aminobacter aminovorans]